MRIEFESKMFSIDHAALLIIDVQGKLANLVYEKNKIHRNIGSLIEAAKILTLPVIYTEQAPEKIGKTIPAIAKHLKKFSPVVKKSFSCCGSMEFLQKLNALNRQQIIVCGIETHVCVYQTTMDLLDRRFKLQVVADAVSSRKKEDKDIALERLKMAGAVLTSAEMIICELVRTTEHKNFKEIIKLIK